MNKKNEPKPQDQGAKPTTPVEPQTPAEPTAPTEPTEDAIIQDMTNLADALVSGVKAEVLAAGGEPQEPQKPAAPSMDLSNSALYEAAQDDPAKFQELLVARDTALETKLTGTFEQKFAELEENLLTKSQQLITKSVNSHAEVTQAIQQFYQANPNLVEHRQVVGMVAQRLRAENPTSPITDVLTKTKELLSDFNKNAQNPINTSPLDPTSRPPVQGAASSNDGLTDTQRQIAETFNINT